MRRPPKFSWVVDDLLAAQGRPTLPGHLQYLCDNNVKYIVTLTKTRPRALLDLPGVLSFVFGENASFVIIVVYARCLTLLEIPEIYWNNFSLLEILEIYWKLAKSLGNFLADSKFLYFTVYQKKHIAVNQD